MKEIKSQNDRLLELQPSSQQREEFLVVVDYLLKFAYDEKHAVQSTKIVTFAKEQYNLYFRRDRVTQILIHLYQLSNNKQYNLPFKVEVKSLKKGLKFYVKSRNYTQKELLDIISSIKNDHSKSETVANKLIDNILSKNVANDEIEIYKDKLKHRDRKINLPRISNGANAFISSLEEICDKEDIISFKLYSNSGIECFTRNKEFRNKEAVFKGIIYRVIDVGSRTKVVIYLPEDKNAIIIPIENIYIIGRKQNPSKKPISFVLSIKNKDVLLSKWIEDFYSGQTGVTLDFVLQMDTVIGSDMHKKMKKSFCNYYKNTNYEFFRKTIKVEANTDLSYEVECVKLKSNLESFLNWYNDLKVIHSFIILEPKDLNDTYFSKLIKLFAQRVNKYGENTYVSYETSYKKEFLDNLERRMDNIKNKFKK